MCMYMHVKRNSLDKFNYYDRCCNCFKKQGTNEQMSVPLQILLLSVIENVHTITKILGFPINMAH